MSTLEKRLQDASVILKTYLKDPPETEIAKALDKIGIDDSEIGLKILESSSSSAADLKAAFEKMGYKDVPEPRIKVAWKMLQGKDPFKTHEIELVDSDTSTGCNAETITFRASQIDIKALEQLKPIGQWSDEDLLKQYGKNCLPQVEEELEKRSKNRPCIVFLDENKQTVDIVVSLQLLRQARHNDTLSTYCTTSGIQRVYKIGDFPMNIFYECPVHSNVLLLDGYCEECGFKWNHNDSNKDKYAFLRLLSETVKIEPVALRTYRDLSFEELSGLFPKLMLKFKDLKEEEKLPTLKRKISNTKSGDPFRVIHKQY